MRPTLLAAALLLPFSQQTQAQETINVYGVVDLAVTSDSNSGKTMAAVDSGQQTASRFGIKGSENLGDGLVARFVLESQIEADRGVPSFAGTLFGSQAWVSLASPLGSVTIGRIFTPYFGAIATNDPFDAKGPGESTRVFYDTGVRMNNTVKYSLPPTLRGVYGDVAYGAGEVAGNARANRQLSMDLGYARGPLNVQVAYHSSYDALGLNPARSYLVGGNYNFGPVRGWLVIARTRNDTTLDTEDTLLGISVPLGLDTVAADYVHKKDKFNSDADATQLALAYYHTLSKRTNLYLIGSRLANDANASYQAALPGGTRRVVAAGIRHQF